MDAPSTQTAEIVESTPLGGCVLPMLKALKWHGTQRQLTESMPHFSQVYNPSMFCDVMERLDYTGHSVRANLHELDERLLPFLFVTDSGSVMVVLKKDKTHCVVFDGEKNSELVYPLTKKDADVGGVAYIFKRQTAREKKSVIQDSWLRKTFLENKRLIYSAIVLSFFINLLALATPLFIMSTYDKVVGASSERMLSMFLIGVSLAYIGYYILSKIRTKLLAVVGARFDRAIGNKIFERLLYLSPIYTESATVGSQVSRIKDFDRLREFLTGPTVTVFFDLPFIFISITLIAILGGTLVFIPVTMVVVYVLIGLVLRLKIKRRTSDMGLASSQEQEFMLETIKNIRAIKCASSEKKWEERFREHSARVSLTNFKLTMLSSVGNALSDAVMVGAGMAVLGFGAIKIIDADITIGGMIATMILIWRVLAPLKTLFNIMPRLLQVENSVKQISRLMSIEPEAPPTDSSVSRRRQLRGRVSFNRVSLRYRSSVDPALVGLTFTVEPGEVLGIVGRNGSGKSTILKVLLGMYAPQAGNIRIDNQDIRQYNPIELRNSIGYVPQTPELFYGTIAANLRMANPDATDEELCIAAKMAGVYKDIMAMPKGFDTPLKDYTSTRLASSFRQALCLARAYLKKSNILLMDEPGALLDEYTDKQLIKTISVLRGKVSILMVSHRPSHLKVVDKIIVIEQGQLVMQGVAKDVLPKIPKELL